MSECHTCYYLKTVSTKYLPSPVVHSLSYVEKSVATNTLESLAHHSDVNESCTNEA